MRIPDSERLTFQFVDRNDEEFLWQLDQDEQVMKYLTGGNKTSRESIRTQFLPRLDAFSNQSKGWGLWKVANRNQPDVFLGWILVRPMGFFNGQRDDSNIELGWRFKRQTWGQGIATEAARQIRDTVRNASVTRFSAIALPQNLASVAVMKKLGMVYSHQFRYTDEVFDEDVVVYSQLAG